MTRLRSLSIAVPWLSSCLGILLSLVLLGAGTPVFAVPPETGSAHSQLLVLAAQFEEPLVATRPTSPAEDAALLEAIQAFQAQTGGDDFQAFETFLARYPYSGWRVALLTNFGLAAYHYGYFSRAIDAWEQAWQTGRLVTEPRGKALVDRALGELLRMHARLGHADRLDALFKDMGDRKVTGPATEAVTGAQEGLWRMQHEPGVAYLCGPMALKHLLLAQGAAGERVQFLDDYRSGPQGVTLAQVSRLAGQAALHHRLIFRDSHQPIPVPAVVHWKVSHFAALVEEQDGRFHIQDPTFGKDLWVTRTALEAEASGYFLVPQAQDHADWREVGIAEAEQVRGMGFTASNDESATTPQDLKTHPPCNGRGMCGYNITEMVVSLNLNDTPVGYAPAKGPAVYVTFTYNQREASQPANFGWFNVSPKWTLNWLSYIQDDPRALSKVSRYVAGGGSVEYSGFHGTTTGTFAPETREAAVLVKTSAQPVIYTRLLADGSREIYAQSNGAVNFPRRVFLTQVIDPAGNPVTLTYDNLLRLTALTDAVGRVTTFVYGLAANPLLITSVTDPFGRSVQLAYDANGRLSQITDVLGLTSQFTYDAASLIAAMTTSYGMTQFTYGQDGTTRWLTATDPLGQSERVEFRHEAPDIPRAEPDAAVPQNMRITNANIFYRNTFFWDKHASAIAAGDYTKARIRHWLHQASATGHVLESSKAPLENRVWFTYPGQLNPIHVGDLDRPNAIGRVLDDGTTQLTQFAYNAFGQLTDAIDPLGRATRFVYDANQIDLLEVQQKTSASGYSTIAKWTYNSQHRPRTFTDAAGQTTAYDYNGAGQLTQATNPLGERTAYEYDSEGNLLRIVNANNQTAASFTYDTFARIASVTDSEGYTVGFAYDAFDRVTQATYPDGTTRQFTWDRLDLVAVTDRQGKKTQYAYDAVRRLIGVTDPLGRQTTLTYYANGALKSLTDPNGNITMWAIDLQSRVTAKTYADGKGDTFTYENTASRLQALTDALGEVKQYGYNVDDTLAAVAYAQAVSPTPGVSFSYDPFFRRLVAMTDGTGTMQYTYQPVGTPGALRLQQETGPYPNATIAYQYDTLSRVSARTVDTSTETFAYDALSRLTSHASALGIFDVGYLGQTQQVTSRLLRGGTLGTSRTYDSNANDRRLQTILHSGATRSYAYTTTPEHLITAIQETAPASSAFPPQAWSYAYDDSYRLLQGASSSGAQYAYGYDPAGNITTVAGPGGATNASYNPLNQIVQFGSDVFAHDANGNLTDDGVYMYAWDAENRLIQVTLKAQPAQSTIFRYDGLGRRIAMVTNGVETRYLWCGDALCQARTANDAVSHRYYLEGEAIPASGALLYYAQDHLGSVRDVLAVQDGSRVAAYDYDPYGNPTQSAGSVATDFRYAGLFYEPNSGLMLAQYRAYDPTTGRWLSRDPIGLGGGDPNLYRYVFNNPTNLNDPSGEIIDTIVDIGFIAFDIAKIITDNAINECGNLEENFAALGADVVGALIPGVTGGGLVVRIRGHVGEVPGGIGRTTTDFLTNVTVKSRGRVIATGTVDVRPTVEGIKSGQIAPRDIFMNRERLLPQKPSGYYQEFVHPTPGVSGSGPQRIIKGRGGELYYTPDHYETFIPLN